MAPRAIIYPVFLGQAGCPFRCVYCRQDRMAAANPPGPDGTAWVQRLSELARIALRQHRPGELAWYGGTFTRLPRGLLTTLLDAARRWVEAGAFTGIRFSTRPDALDERLLDFLSAYPVTTIELGVQSLTDRVLTASRRGYSAAAAGQAVARARRRGYRVGIQLMVGLPGETPSDFAATVTETLRLAPNLVRIYPTLVLAGTVLADWHASGRYLPLSLEQALDQVCDAYSRLRQAGIRVARIGLHADPDLSRPGVIAAGPHHPAFGHLVKALWWRRRLLENLKESGRAIGASECLVLRVPVRQVSEVLGPRRSNLWMLCRELGGRRVRIEGDAGLAADQWRWQREEFNAAVC